MQLKTQINILTSSSKDNCYTFIWKDESDLLNQIDTLVFSFRDSEAITPAKTILECILTRFSDRTKTYGGMSLDLESFNDVPEFVMDAINKIIKEQKSKSGNNILSLNVDELYELFSLSEFRRTRLNKIL
jgi:hypothetical protein